jgi:hypothetical protein
MQHGALDPGCLRQFGEHARWHRPPAERAPVGAPRPNGCVQLELMLLRPTGPGQPHRGEQQLLARIGKQPDYRMAAGHCDGQAKVK